jgi:hypothetical protein
LVRDTGRGRVGRRVRNGHKILNRVGVEPPYGKRAFQQPIAMQAGSNSALGGNEKALFEREAGRFSL